MKQRMKSGLNLGVITGAIALIIGVIINLIYPTFTLQYAFTTALGTFAANFLIGALNPLI